MAESSPSVAAQDAPPRPRCDARLVANWSSCAQVGVQVGNGGQSEGVAAVGAKKAWERAQIELRVGLEGESAARRGQVEMEERVERRVRAQAACRKVSVSASRASGTARGDGEVKLVSKVEVDGIVEIADVRLVASVSTLPGESVFAARATADRHCGSHNIAAECCVWSAWGSAGDVWALSTGAMAL